ncbi:MAG: acetyl-CoA carboxylase biotin carboxyl carrier protein, partial [Acidobacteria bacterium]|nr:acetyl-CoA carboxylase biotin carboxyl carrier protein [Acidobacteriota bacterium]
MDKEILELIDLISQSNFVEFELQREGFKIKLVKADSRSSSEGRGMPSSSPAGAPIQAAPAPAPAAALAPAPSSSGFHEVKSPLVGTFYRAPSPEAPSFTEVGRTVKAGQVLCIVEAMKLMNEIESDTDGVVEEILASNGQPVEYGEVL